MRIITTLVLLAALVVSCGTNEPTAPDPDGPELDRMEAVTVTYTDPALDYIFEAYADGVLTDTERATLRDLSAPAFTITIGDNTICWKPNAPRRTAQGIDEFPLDCRATRDRHDSCRPVHLLPGPDG